MAGLVVTVIAPGYALARVVSLQRRLPPLGVAASLPALGLAVWLPPLVVGLLVHVPFWTVNVVVIGATAVALSWCWDEGVPFDREHLAVLGAGLVVAVLATRWVPPLSGDALFHAGRIRKLLDLQLDLDRRHLGVQERRRARRVRRPAAARGPGRCRAAHRDSSRPPPTRGWCRCSR